MLKFSRLHLLWFLPLGLLLVAGLIISKTTGMPFGFLTRDPTAILGGHPLVGAISNLGILMWCFAASVCLFAGFSAKGQISVEFHRALLFAGVLSSILLIDDLFLFHEELGPKYLAISETVIYGFYAAVALGYLVSFRKILLAHEPFYLFLSLAMLGGSILIDKATESAPTLNTFFFEESFKYLGILSWCIYHGRLSGRVVERN